MKRLIYTQRVEVVERYGERRDCADQQIARFLSTCGYLPIPVPNIPKVAEQIFDDVPPCGVVLTGGNSLTKYGGDAPDRDETESRLLMSAFDRGVPVFAFCRGMQVVLDRFGCSLKKIEKHAATRHTICGEISRSVNSYHTMSAFDAAPPLRVTAVADDGAIEAVACTSPRLTAIMWHPEREEVYDEADIELVKALFG